MIDSTQHTGWPGTDLSSFLDSLPARPRLLGLGEPTHGEEEFLRVRNDVLRQLVADEGYRSIAIESSCLAALLADDFVSGGPGSLDDALRAGFSHGFGDYAANRELIAWLRETNQHRTEGDRVRFYGIDPPTELMSAPSPRESLLALHTYLAEHLNDVPGSVAEIVELVGEESRWANQDAMLDAAVSIGGSAEAVQLRLLADDLGTLLRTESPRLRPASADDFWLAGLHARTATGLSRYHAAMADPTPSRLTRLAALRAAIMAENLATIADRERDRGPTLVFTHNAHLQRLPASMWLGPWYVEWWSVGAITAARYGHDYAHVAMDMGVAQHLAVPEPVPDTLHGTLRAIAAHRHVFDSVRLTAALGDRLSTMAAREDTSDNWRYAPLPPAHLTHTDGLLFLREIATGTGE